MGSEGSLCHILFNKTASPISRLAVIQPDAFSWTYEQLRESVAALGGKLRASGLRRRDTVAVLMPDGVAGLVTQLGVIDVCGCAPLDPSLTEPELRRDLIELGVRAIICTSEHDLGSRMAAELGLIRVMAWCSGNRLLWDVFDAHEDLSNAKHSRKSNLGAAILLHTSATTGRRKIVPLTTTNLKAICDNSRRSLGLREDDRLLLMARLFHAQGILSALIQWSAGGCVLVPGVSGPAALTKLIFDLNVTWYTCGPTLHQAILTELRKQGLTRPQALRFVRSGGNILSGELKKALGEELGVPILDMYGLSETGAVAATPLDQPEARGWKSVGPQIAIMSKEGQELPPGVEGEIVVRGPSVMEGYWNDDAANREAFWTLGEDRWFRTGDLGRIDALGNLTMSGRSKEIINRGAQKIQPNEVDAALRQHPGVKAVAAFGVPHPTLGEDVACAVVLKDGAFVTEAELQAFARRSLARYKVPRRVHFVTEIPHGASGKPQRLLLKDRLAVRSTDGLLVASPLPAPELSPVERAIAEVWCRRLGCAEVQPQDDFFQLGGDSLEAESMLAEVEATLQVKLGPGSSERFFEAPYLETLGTLISTPAVLLRERSSEIRVYDLPGSGAQMDAFLIPADDDLGLYYRSLSRYMGHHRRMSLVRPENGIYESGPDLVERAAAEAAAVIREKRAQGPYLIGGFCLGGLIAFETARFLEQQGERVLLVLFDSPCPGQPHVFRDCKVYAKQVVHLVRAVPRGEKEWRNVAGFIRLTLRRVLWLILANSKAYWRTSAKGKLMEWLRRAAQKGYLPLYRPARSRIPILHFVASGSRSLLREASLQAWKNTTSAETLHVSVLGDHHSIFTDANQVLITDTVSRWEKAQTAK